MYDVLMYMHVTFSKQRVFESTMVQPLLHQGVTAVCYTPALQWHSRNSRVLWSSVLWYLGCFSFLVINFNQFDYSGGVCVVWIVAIFST